MQINRCRVDERKCHKNCEKIRKNKNRCVIICSLFLNERSKNKKKRKTKPFFFFFSFLRLSRSFGVAQWNLAYKNNHFHYFILFFRCVGGLANRIARRHHSHENGLDHESNVRKMYNIYTITRINRSFNTQTNEIEFEATQFEASVFKIYCLCLSRNIHRSFIQSLFIFWIRSNIYAWIVVDIIW